MNRTAQEVAAWRRDRRAMFVAFELSVVLPTLALLVFFVGGNPHVLKPELLLWAASVALVELLPVPFWRGAHLSMGFPLLIAMGFLYPPGAAGCAALIGSFDLREIRREVAPLRAL